MHTKRWLWAYCVDMQDDLRLCCLPTEALVMRNFDLKSLKPDQSLCCLHTEALGPWLANAYQAMTLSIWCGYAGWSETLLPVDRSLGSLASQCIPSDDWAYCVDMQADLRLCFLPTEALVMRNFDLKSFKPDQSLCCLHTEALGPWLANAYQAMTLSIWCGYAGWSETLLPADRSLGSLASQCIPSNDWAYCVDMQADLRLCFLLTEALGPWLASAYQAITLSIWCGYAGWSETLLPADRSLGSLASQCIPSDDSEHMVWICRLIRDFAACRQKPWVLG